MPIAMRLFLVGSVITLLTGCAQVGVLSGGEKDETAPVPTTRPEQGQTQFTGNSIEFTFDEHVTLNNPKENIFMIPQVNGIQAVLKKKTLTVRWNETLLPNTTYVMYLNNAVKDIHEGNDSLMTYVFSTGEMIDSLRYEVELVDAWSNEAMKNIFIGLYSDTNTTSPLYFSRSNSRGQVQFTNLKSGSYTVRAFPDEDKDRKLNRSEMRGFRESTLVLDSSIIDTVPIRLSKPVELKARNPSFIGPGLIGVGAPFSLESARFEILGQQVTRILPIHSDSLLLGFCPDTLVRAELLVTHQYGSDTLRFSTPKREKEKPLIWKSEASKKGIGPHQNFEFELNDVITSLDKERIQLMDLTDSSSLEILSAQFDFNKIRIEFDRKNRKSVELKLSPGAVVGACGKPSEALQQVIQLKSEKDYGTLFVKFISDDRPLIVELMEGNSVVERKRCSSIEGIRFDRIEPAEYSFRVIHDQNNNGRWDVGDEAENRQPERVFYFTTTTKVRGNWESEVELDLSK